MRIYSYLFLMMGCLGGANASPAINPGPMFGFLDDGKSAVLKRIYNSGTSTAFVKVVVQEITYDANGQPVEQPPKALSAAPLAQQNTLLASPARMIIPANGMQSTRLLFMGSRAQERYYRVRFIPVLPSSADTFDQSADDQQAYKNTLVAQVTLLTGFGTLLFVRPDKVVFDTRLKDEKDTYSIHNAGNSVIALDFVKTCHVEITTQCSAIAQHYVLPGRTYTFTKEPDKVHSFVLQEGRAERTISFSTT
jgi:Mat/Ecp fimbriae periplasmic chaperone